jgi:hypothetical protein
MSGFEYQVAGHMLGEGMLLEGLAVVRAIHDRYHPARRNPWNEVECGNHYARSMASWGVLLALTGCSWDGRDRTLRFRPQPAAYSETGFATFFSTADGWGRFQVDGHGATVELLHGRLQATLIEVDAGPLGRFRAENPAALAAGDILALDAVTA